MFNDVILSKCVKDKYRHRYDNNPKFHVYADWKKMKYNKFTSNKVQANKCQ